MIDSTSSRMEGPRSRSSPAIIESDRDTAGSTVRAEGFRGEQGDSLRSLLRSSLLRPASKSRLRPRGTSRGLQVSERESSEEPPEKEPEDGTRRHMVGDREMLLIPGTVRRLGVDRSAVQELVLVVQVQAGWFGRGLLLGHKQGQ